MDTQAQQRQTPEVRFLLGELSDAEFRAEMAKEPTLRQQIESDEGWFYYKAKVFEAIARAYMHAKLKENQERNRLFVVGLEDQITAMNKVRQEQIQGGGYFDLR